MSPPLFIGPVFLENDQCKYSKRSSNKHGRIGFGKCPACVLRCFPGDCDRSAGKYGDYASQGSNFLREHDRSKKGGGYGSAVHGVGVLLKDEKFRVPNKQGTPRIEYIGMREITVVFVEFEYINNEKITKVKERLKIPLEQLTAPQWWGLYGKLCELDGTPAADRDLQFGAYLVARAEYLKTAKDKLIASGKDDDIKGPLAEIERMSENPNTRDAGK